MIGRAVLDKSRSSERQSWELQSRGRVWEAALGKAILGKAALGSASLGEAILGDPVPHEVPNEDRDIASESSLQNKTRIKREFNKN